MLMESFTDKELDIWRKHFDGKKLSRAEKCTLTRAKKRDLKNFATELAVLSIIIIPVVVFIVRTCVWK